MDPYGAYIVAASRQEDYVREANAERGAGAVRRRTRDPQTEPRSAPRRQEVARPAIA